MGGHSGGLCGMSSVTPRPNPTLLHLLSALGSHTASAALCHHQLGVRTAGEVMFIPGHLQYRTPWFLQSEGWSSVQGYV